MTLDLYGTIAGKGVNWQKR